MDKIFFTLHLSFGDRDVGLANLTLHFVKVT